MICRHAAVFRLATAAADAVLAVAALLVAAQVRFGPLPKAGGAFEEVLPSPLLAVGWFVASWIAILWLNGLYRSRTQWTLRGVATSVLRATAVQAAVTLSALFLFKLPDVSRLFLLIVFPWLAFSAFAVRVAIRHLLVVLRRHGRNVRYMLILGANARARAFADLVESHAELGLIVIGHLKAGATDNGVALGRPLLGSVDRLEEILHGRVVDEVAICLPFAMEDLIEQASLLCEQEGKTVRVPIAPIERVLATARFDSIDGVGIYSLSSGPDRALGLIAKRILDTTAAGALLVLLSPVLLVIALAIRLESSGPVLYRHTRVGLHGREFRMVKFRSMCLDADEKLDGLLEFNEIRGHAFKLQADPRVTRVGRVLRRISLDELPQLWNVLRGNMSLVGPRPPLPIEVAKYDVWHRRRLSMKPGMTGLWQVGERRSPQFDRWVEKDLEYIDSWSLWLDLKILVRTVPAMLGGEGR